jgi:hypothetical protein
VASKFAEYLPISNKQIPGLKPVKRRKKALKTGTKVYEKNMTDVERGGIFMLLFKKSLQLYTKNG